MEMTTEEFQNYKLEIEELTALLNNEWHDLKNLIISNNINLERTLLVGYYEDAEGKEHGLLYNKKDNFILKFEVFNNTISLTSIDHGHEESDEYPQLLVAISLAD
ncbi:hypothetical protein [Sphingobacterium sp. UDSM-2020]|uniref:hypothetical protein n=1 Tax=Sphingobacterium sp. UDSM-2020 TaxID=2795738 RepID=UPI001935B5BA|nr:hypothetical protein [Sphingobacterium sp. UDSM-2020]QQD13968.1 hypothetical protein JAZ75_00020 [Sphingobacterium sp. UDSM-2020]